MFGFGNSEPGLQLSVERINLGLQVPTIVEIGMWKEKQEIWNYHQNWCSLVFHLAWYLSLALFRCNLKVGVSTFRRKGPKIIPQRCEASVNSLRIRKASPPGSQGVGSRKTALITSKPDNLAWPQNQRNVWRHVKGRINLVNNMEARQIELFSGGHSELPQFKPKRTGFTLSTLHVHQNFTLPTFLKPASLHSSATDFWEPFLSTIFFLRFQKRRIARCQMQHFHCTKCSTIFSANAKITSSSTQLGIKEHFLEAPESQHNNSHMHLHVTITIWNPESGASRFRNLSASESTTHQEPIGFGISPVRMHSSQLPHNPTTFASHLDVASLGVAALSCVCLTTGSLVDTRLHRVLIDTSDRNIPWLNEAHLAGISHLPDQKLFGKYFAWNDDRKSTYRLNLYDLDETPGFLKLASGGERQGTVWALDCAVSAWYVDEWWRGGWLEGFAIAASLLDVLDIFFLRKTLVNKIDEIPTIFQCKPGPQRFHRDDARP